MQNKSCLRIINQKTVEQHGGINGLIRHDRRENIWSDQEVNEDFIGSNRSIILHPFDKVREQHKQIVKAKTGRRMQASTLDIREAVVELPDDCTIEKLKELGNVICSTPLRRSVNEKEKTGKKSKLKSVPIIDEYGRQVVSSLGLRLIACFLHKDEGHWVNADGESAYLHKEKDGNWHDVEGNVHSPKKEGLVWKQHTHGHLWFAMIDQKTGKTIRISTDELSQLQTIVAEHLGMERGVFGSKATRWDQEAYNKKKICEGLEKEYTERLKLLESLNEKIDIAHQNLHEEQQRQAARRMYEEKERERRKEMEAEQERLMSDIEKMKAEESHIRPIVDLGNQLKDNILSRLKNIFSKYAPDEEVLDFKVEKENYKYTDLQHKEAEGVHLIYKVKSKDREGQRWIYTVQEDDYYKSDDKLIKKISELFYQIKNVASLLINNDKTQQKEKKSGIRM